MIQHPPPVSLKEQYSRLCGLQMTQLKMTIGSEDIIIFSKHNRSFMLSKRERDHSQADILSASKERGYEYWLKIQREEMARADNINFINPSSALFEDNRRRKNSYYLCSRCGKPKKGHICKASISSTSNSNSNSTGANGTTKEDDDDEEEEDEEEYKVDPDDPEYEDEEVPDDDDEYPFKDRSASDIYPDSAQKSGSVRRSGRKRRHPGFYGSDDDL